MACEGRLEGVGGWNRMICKELTGWNDAALSGGEISRRGDEGGKEKG